MNRLIIIGNGFDLAHGLPTKYGDFFENYLMQAFEIFRQKRHYEGLLTMNYKSSVNFTDLSSIKSLDNIFSFFNAQKHYVELRYSNLFIETLKVNYDELKWVDLENEYFEELKKTKRNDRFDFEKVTKLNADFNSIKVELEKYLIKVMRENKNLTPTRNFSKIFAAPILKEEVLLKELEGDTLPNNIHILNFNYTSTIERTVDFIENIPVHINYIHGQLHYEENPLIFGFGDEYDNDYKDFENKKNNILFEHIKSFGYFKTQNYHNLIRFIESDDYQVYIIGHSCGLSDRTMLKEIFENEKCKSIKIFFYEKHDKTNDYVEKTMEISRHFENKGLMRKKIVPLPLSKKM